MKTLILFFCLVLSSASAQNMLVKFYPANQPYTGLTNYPAQVQPVSFTTNVAGWNTNVTVAVYESHMATLRPKYAAAESNAVWQAQQDLNADIAQLVVAYSNVQWASDNWAGTTNLANLRTAMKFNVDTLLKLKPVLIEMYQRK